MFARRVQGLEPSGIRKILDMAAVATDPVDLSIGQPDFDMPEAAKEESIYWIQKGFNRYTQSQGIPELRDKLVELLKREGMLFEDVIVTNGAAGALTLFFLALVEEGDEVAITDPYFLNYRHLITLTQAVPKFINTYPDFRMREEEIHKVITPRTKLIVVNSPGNPTGIVYTLEEIQWVVDAARKNDCWIISDEVYDRFVYDQDHVSPARFYAKTLIVNSFSKSSGMPGWRVGYGTGPKELITKILPLQQYLYACAPSVAQKAAMVSINRDMSADLARIKKKRDLIYQGLKDHYEVQKPEGAFYIFPKAPGDDCHGFIKRALEQDLFLSPGDTFSRQATHFRISYAVPEDVLLRGIEILRNLAH